MKIEIDVDIPEGFEATGEYRRVKEGEWGLSKDNTPRQMTGMETSNYEYIILRKVPRKPTAEHVGEIIEVKDRYGWVKRRLLFVTDEGWWCRGGLFMAFLWKEARVIE